MIIFVIVLEVIVLATIIELFILYKKYKDEAEILISVNNIGKLVSRRLCNRCYELESNVISKSLGFKVNLPKEVSDLSRRRYKRRKRRGKRK